MSYTTVGYRVSYQEGKIRWYNHKDARSEAVTEAKRLAALGCGDIRIERETTLREDITDEALKAQQA